MKLYFFILTFCFTAFGYVQKKVNLHTFSFISYSLRFPQALLNETTFEEANPLNKWGKEIATAKNLIITDSIARKGKYSARFELTKDDPILNNGIRAEITLPCETENERWYGMSNFFPASYTPDAEPEIVLQWHDMPDFKLGETWRSPPISFWVVDDHIHLKIMWATERINSNNTITGQREFDLGYVEKEKWNDWVIHIIFSYKVDGVIEIWKNKVKILNYNGPNSYNDEKYPYLKLGIYKWPWMKKETRDKSTVNERVLFYDEIRVGDKYSSLEAVSPR